MRRGVLTFALSVALLLPLVGSAQVFQIRTPEPDVTAAAADWQLHDDAIVFNSLIYYPTREFRMFDGQVMAQVGIFDRVPIYADTTAEPFRFIYVPVGRDRLRTYEHPIDVATMTGTSPTRALTLTVDQRTLPSAITVVPPSTANTVAASVVYAPSVPLTAGSDVVGTSGTVIPRATGTTYVAPEPTVTAPATRTTRGHALETIPRPRGINAVWLDFNGARWYSAGAAVPYFADRFTAVGDLHGMTVYRAVHGPSNEIWVPTVPGGPVAPYKKR